jgi:nitrate reductase molybdenum cofactor assembly chaperone NarJ/NarW
MLTARILGLLLDYPRAEVRAQTAALASALREDGRIGGPALDAVMACLVIHGRKPLFDLQEEYVALFDSSRGLSLYIYEHVHGDGSLRGQAMVKLADLYAEAGLAVTGGQLPDYIPAFCEFVSLCDEARARALLGEAAALFAVLARRLEARESRYAAVLDALVSISGAAVDAAQVDALVEVALDEDALDDQWEEQPVIFGAGCETTAGRRGGDPLLQIQPASRVPPDHGPRAGRAARPEDPRG